jgi:hypothetical protein
MSSTERTDDLGMYIPKVFIHILHLGSLEILLISRSELVSLAVVEPASYSRPTLSSHFR